MPCIYVPVVGLDQQSGENSADEQCATWRTTNR